MRNLELFHTQKLDTGGNPYYMIVDHFNKTFSPIFDDGLMYRYKPPYSSVLSTREEIEIKRDYYIDWGYGVTGEFG